MAPSFGSQLTIMATVKFETTFYEELYTNMDQQLAEISEGRTTVESTMRAISLLRETIAKLRAGMTEPFPDRDAEIAFFREVWPRFYGKLFFFLLVSRFEGDRLGLPVGELPALIQRKELKTARFFRRNREFWHYYRSGSPLISGQFTREYSRSCVFDPLSPVLDPEGATLASWRAAWGLAYEDYRQFLREAGESGSNQHGLRYEWNETRTAAVELIKSQAEAGSIFIDGKPATAAQLRADFEEKYNEDLKDFDKLLYASDTRKKDPTPYLTKLMNAFVGRRVRLRK